MKLGAHVSVAGGLDTAPQRAVELGCESLQLFSRNQRQWRPRALQVEECQAFRRGCKQSSLHRACTHASYLINLASSDPTIRRRSIAAMADELSRAEALGIPYVVVHPGAHKGKGLEHGWQQVASAVHQAIAQAKVKHTRILLENTAGQGTCLGATLSELGEGLSLIDPVCGVGVCLDTCHLFAAGNDFRSEQDYLQLKKKIARTIGLRRVCVIHLNDSAREFDSRVDNHAAIGKGKIGSKAFSHWVKDPSWKNVLGILETPGGEANYKRELRLLKRMRQKAK